MKAIIFDLDGTLADSMPVHFRAWNVTMKRYGINFGEDRFYALGGWPTVDIAALLAEEAGIELDARAVALEKEHAYVEQLDAIVPCPTVMDVARTHRGKLPMAIATGSERWLAEKTLAHLGISDWFDAVVCADDVERGKPDPAVFLIAAERLGVEPGDCLVYEDTDPGIEAATRAGMACVDVRTM